MRRWLSLTLIMVLCLLSCYDGLQEVYEEGKGYQLRDRGPSGGWIFYINPSYKADGWRYMEAAPEDQDHGGGDEWSSIPNAFVNGVSALPADIGTGIVNTDAIIAQNNGAQSAAKLCRDYRGGGYSDWFLPSYEELNLMYLNLHKQTLGGFKLSYYWSSTESSSTYVINLSFIDGLNMAISKGSAYYIRAARRF